MSIHQKCITWAMMALCVCLWAGTVSCTRKIDKSHTVMRGGLVYEAGVQEPFSGIVAGKSRRENYRTYPVTFKKSYQNGRLHGKSYFRYENGKIESVEPYQNGLLDGVVTQFYENGQRKARIHFTQGMRGGSEGETFWDENGKRIKG